MTDTFNITNSPNHSHIQINLSNVQNVQTVIDIAKGTTKEIMYPLFRDGLIVIIGYLASHLISSSSTLITEEQKKDTGWKGYKGTVMTSLSYLGKLTKFFADRPLLFFGIAGCAYVYLKLK